MANEDRWLDSLEDDWAQDAFEQDDETDADTLAEARRENESDLELEDGGPR